MKKMTRKKIRRCNARFFTVYGTLLVAAALAVIFGYSEIRTMLTEYESVQSKYVAEEAFRMFGELDYGAMYAWEKEENRAMTDEAAYEMFAASHLSGREITYRDSYRGEGDGEKIYSVYADGKRFASFTIQLSGEKTPHGMEKWKFVSAEINLLENSFRDYSIRCHTGNRVFVDGVEIPLTDMTETGILEGYEGHLKSGMSAPRSYEYTVSGKLNAPVVTVEQPDGTMKTVEMDAQGVYSIGYQYQDDTLKADRETWIVDTAKTISEYTIGHANMNDIGRRVDRNSDAYAFIGKIDTSIIFNHYKYEFANVRTENYIQFSEDCFCVDVYYDFVVYYYEATKTHETAYRFFFHKVNGTWMLYDFITR